MKRNRSMKESLANSRNGFIGIKKDGSSANKDQ